MTEVVESIFCLIQNIDLVLRDIYIDIEIIKKINSDKFKDLNTKQKDFLEYMANRVSRNLIVLLYCILDEPKEKNGINFQKVLNVYQQVKNKVADNYIKYKNAYNSIKDLNEFKKLKDARDKLFAHLDYGYIKKHLEEILGLNIIDLELIFDKVVILFNEICKDQTIKYNAVMLHWDKWIPEQEHEIQILDDLINYN